MKLHWSPRSPFVRKVMVVVHETSLTDRVTPVETHVAMKDTNAELMQINPLNKLPTLIRDDGSVLFDSAVICEYLDSLHEDDKLFPPSGEERFTALRWQALGDGLLELLVLRQNELLRPPNIQSQPHFAAFEAKITAVADFLEHEIGSLEAVPLNIGHITIGVALSYSDFRYSEWDWRYSRPMLAAWHKTFAARPSMQATAPRYA